MRTEDDERPDIQLRPTYAKVKRDVCGTKIKFGSRKTATRAALNILAKGRGFTRMYKCKDHYHLTSMI